MRKISTLYTVIVLALIYMIAPANAQTPPTPPPPPLLPGTEFIDEDLTEVNLDAEGVQPGSTAHVTINVTNDDNSVDNYSYDIVVAADATFSIPLISAVRAKHVVIDVDYMRMLSVPQLTPAANFPNFPSPFTVLGFAHFCTAVDGDGDCISWAPHPQQWWNEDLADNMRPYFCNTHVPDASNGFDTDNCSSDYPASFYTLNPLIKQNFHVVWDRGLGGVDVSGRATPTANIAIFSTGDSTFSSNVMEEDDGNYESISTLWPLWTKWLQGNGIWAPPDPRHSWVSRGDYTMPFQPHAEADLIGPGRLGTTQFTALILNMDWNYGLGAFLPVDGGTDSGATVFNVDIRTGIPIIPVTPGEDDGFPSPGNGSDFNAALGAAIAIGMSLFGTSDSVDDSYGQKPYADLTEQISMMDNKIEEQRQMIADTEQQQKSIESIQKEKVDAIVDVAPDELVCEIVSVANVDSVRTMLGKDVKTHILRNNLMSNVQRKKGSLGSLSKRERLQWRVEDVKAKHCTKGGAGSAFEQFCDKPAGSANTELAHLSPECLLGTRTIDSDPEVGDMDESCMQYMLLVSPAHDPVTLPSQHMLRSKGTSEYESAIAEYVPALTNHATIISDSLSSMHAATLRTSSESVDEFRALMVELGFSTIEIDRNIPASGAGLSETAQLEMISKFMITNPTFFVRLQTNEANVSRVRVLLRSLSLTLDHHINDMVVNKGRQMAGMNAILLRDDRQRANTDLRDANVR